MLLHISDLRNFFEIPCARRTVERVDAAIEGALVNLDTKPLQFLDGLSWRGVFGLPKQVRLGLEQETRCVHRYVMV